VAATELLDKLRTDNEDIIQYLHRKLQARDDQCSELKERLKGLQRLPRMVVDVFLKHFSLILMFLYYLRPARKKVKTMNDRSL
jgi:hypothetical protein